MPIILQVLINRGMLYLDVRDYRNALVDFNQVSEVSVHVCFEMNSANFETNVSMQIQSDDPTLWQSIAFCHHK